MGTGPYATQHYRACPARGADLIAQAKGFNPIRTV